MSFALVGLGLGDEKDITMRGFEIAKSADVVYLECYTAVLISATVDRLAEFFGRPVVVADREMVESGEVLNEAEAGKSVALLVVGDPFGATTHSDLVVRCNEKKIPVITVNNASILNAVGVCGLQLYRFGQVLSLCFWTDTWRPDSWYDRLLSNRREGIHTLLLVDIKVKEISDENLARGRKIYEPPRFMRINEAVQQVLDVEAKHKKGAIDEHTIGVGLARVGAATQQIVAAPLKDLLQVDFGEPLHSVIVCGDMHEMEAEHVALFAQTAEHKEIILKKVNSRPPAVVTGSSAAVADGEES